MAPDRAPSCVRSPAARAPRTERIGVVRQPSQRLLEQREGPRIQLADRRLRRERERRLRAPPRRRAHGRAPPPARRPPPRGRVDRREPAPRLAPRRAPSIATRRSARATVGFDAGSCIRAASAKAKRDDAWRAARSAALAASGPASTPASSQ
jgi:hypothetical protein